MKRARCHRTVHPCPWSPTVGGAVTVGVHVAESQGSAGPLEQHVETGTARSHPHLDSGETPVPKSTHMPHTPANFGGIYN